MISQAHIERDRRGRRALVLRAAFLLAILPSVVACLQDRQPADLTTLSLDQLANLEVTTTSRQPERWWSAPNGIDIVTGDDIRRAGDLNLPDAIRLATRVPGGQPNAWRRGDRLRRKRVLDPH